MLGRILYPNAGDGVNVRIVSFDDSVNVRLINFGVGVDTNVNMLVRLHLNAGGSVSVGGSDQG